MESSSSGDISSHNTGTPGSTSIYNSSDTAEYSAIPGNIVAREVLITTNTVSASSLSYSAYRYRYITAELAAIMGRYDYSTGSASSYILAISVTYTIASIR